jgi:hypothetical protein
MNRRGVVCLAMIAVAMQVAAEDRKVNLSGRWVIDATQGSYGRMAPPRSYVEVIEHKDPLITIATTSQDQRGETKSFLKLASNGVESINEVNGNEFRSKSRWDDGKLITTVTGDRGLQMVEVRSLSADGKMQTVETYMGELRGTPQMKRVMTKATAGH